MLTPNPHAVRNVPLKQLDYVEATLSTVPYVAP